MKNMKRMVAVIAASGLALGAMPGVANAQSELLGLDLDLLNGSIGVDLGAVLGSSEGGSTELPALSDSLGSGSDSLPTDSLGTGSDGLPTDSLDPASLGTGSDSLPTDSLDPASLGTGSDSLPTDSLGEGSSEGSLDTGSLTSLSADLPTDSLGDGSTELPALSDSLGSGSDSESLDPASLGTGSDSLPTDSLGTGSEGLGSEAGGSTTVIEGSLDSGSLGAEEILALGSLAGAGIAIGLIVSGGVNLPALPGLPAIDVAAVCNLPQEAIDFLKDNGSMERHECEPEEQPAP